MSHFTTVETKIKDLVALKEALQELGFDFTEALETESVEVKGYHGAKTKARLAIHVSKTYDVGVRVTQEGIEFVADWWGVEVTRGVTEQEFINQVVQHYALAKVKQEVKARNWTLATQEVTQEQSVKVRISAW